MKNQSIGKNAVFNVIKQICSIIFPLITYPYISRILGPDKLGKYSFADSIIQYFIILAGLGVPTYAVRECSMLRNDKTELNRFASEIFSINLLALLISYLLLFAVVCFVPRIRENRLLVAIMSIEVFASVVGRDWVNTVFEDFFYIAIRYILIQGLAIILMFVLVRKESDYVIYASISATAYSTGFFVNVLYTRKYVRFGISRPRNLRKHLKPILLLFCSTIAINIYIHSDITVLGLLAGDSETGIYTVVSKVYIVIKALLNAIITVTIPRLAKFLGEDDHAHYNELLATLRKYLYTLVVPAVVGTVCLGKDMLRIIGGRQYASGLPSLYMLAGALFFAIFGCFYTQGILIPNRKENVFFCATAISAITNILLNILIIPRMGMLGAALTTLIAEMIIVIISKVHARRCHEKFDDGGLFSIGIGCGGIIATCRIVSMLHLKTALEIVVSIIGSVIIYVLILTATGNSCVKETFERILYVRKGLHHEE